MMKLHFYGTGASEGVPAIFCRCENCKKIRKMGGKNYRSRTSCQIDDDLMIDFSADIFDHMRFGGLDMSNIKTLIITHTHSDHFYPEELIHVAPPYAWPEGKEKLTVYGNESACDRLLKLCSSQTMPYIDINPIHNMEEVKTGGFEVKALPAEHDPTQECHLYILRKGMKNLLYAHDTGYFPEITWKELQKEHLDGVVLDCTCCNGHSYFQHHMGFQDNLKIKQRMLEEEIADQKTVFISTHFVHTYGPFQQELEKAFAPYGFIAAYDGMEVEI